MTLAEALRITSQRHPDAPERRVFLLTGFEPLQLGTFIVAIARLNAPDARWKVETGSFGNWTENLNRAADSEAEVVLAVLEWSDLDPRLGARGTGGWTGDLVKEAKRFLASVREPLRQLSARKRTVLAGPLLPLLPVDTTPGEELGVLGSGLRLAMSEFIDWIIVNTQTIVASPEALAEPALESRRDLSLDLAAGHPLSTACAAELAQLLWRLAFPVPRKKGIITDLDNTLWKGILGEDGLEGIAWSLDGRAQSHGLYQQALASLADSGVLVAVASKNDPALTKSALLRPGLLIDPERIFPVEAGWGAKSDAVGRILQTWNIAPDSVVFVDDSVHEIEEVRSLYPQVECLRFNGADPAAVIRLIERVRNLCGKRNVSNDDRLRSASIRTALDAASEARATDPETFLCSLQARLTIGRADARSFELVNKTNQFNLNGRRYTHAEWHEALNGEGTIALSLGYTDRFGPLGQIGVILGRQDGGGLVISAWVLSCRAFSRRIEHRALRFLFEMPSVERIRLKFRNTERNGPFREFLQGLAGTPPGGTVEITREDAAARLPRTDHTIETAPDFTYARITAR